MTAEPTAHPVSYFGWETGRSFVRCYGCVDGCTSLMSNPNGTRASRFDPAVQRAGCEARIARANRRAADLAPIIDELRAAGITSSKAIAKALDKLGVPTLSGRGHWHPMQVSRLLRRLAGAERSA